MTRLAGSFRVVLFYVSISTLAFAQECSDGIDNDGDGLVDWEYDLGCTGADDPTEGGLASREIENGWTVLEPGLTTRIFYVSSSTGDDGNDGLSPGQALRTFDAAFNKTFEKYGDWILLKRGDVWFESLQVRNGRSRTDPFVIGSYGTSTERPLLKTGAGRGIRVCCRDYSDFVLLGIHMYAHTRNRDSAEYVSMAGAEGFDFFT